MISPFKLMWSIGPSRCLIDFTGLFSVAMLCFFLFPMIFFVGATSLWCYNKYSHISTLTTYAASYIRPRKHNSKRSTYHQWCALPTNRTLVALHPSQYMFLNPPRDVIRSTACFRLCVHTLGFETVTYQV
jgi:hypothetical protein